MLGINTTLQQDRYRITRQFGQNEFTASYEAYDNVLKTNVVIKEISINPKKVSTPAQQESTKLLFAKEGRVLTDIKHDSLINIFDSFSEIDRQYVVIESTEGHHLGEIVERNKKPFSLLEVVRWADQMLDALSYLHTRTPALIHCGIKPQNIKLTSDGKVKLLTFDITKDSNDKPLTSITNQTFDKTHLNYLPLELIWNGLDPASQNVILNSYDEKAEKILELPADARSDIYELGATLYYLATAQMPIDPLERSIDTLEGKPDPLLTPNQLNHEIPLEVSDVLMKALEIRRENRFDSAVIMRHILRAAFSKIKQIEAEKAKKLEAELKLAETRRLEEERRIFEQKKLAVEAEQKQLEQERQQIEKTKLELETEQKRQNELIASQLREAEAQRLKADQLAAKAEKHLTEKDEIFELDFTEVLELDTAKPIAESSKTSKIIESELSPITPVSKSNEFDGMFSVPPKENSTMKRMAAAAVVLVVLGGASWGGWTVLSAKSESASKSVSSQSIASDDMILPTPLPETTSTPTVETKTETTSSAPTDPPSTEAIVNQTAFQKTCCNRYCSTKKPAVATVKAPTSQKKNVTVDDIISGN